MTIANIPYNAEYLFVDVRIEKEASVIGAIPDETIDLLLNHDNHLFNIYQIDTTVESGEAIKLKPAYNNVPSELEGDLPIPDVNTKLTKSDGRDGGTFEYTIPFKFELDIDTASKIIFEFDNETTEIDLTTENTVI
ncbi:hypothetical protein HZY86_07545 [Aerococcaceae bacterium DSM 111020]|nr:hypothetical protein [Aerococcaceae bacterium DSM 111020]